MQKTCSPWETEKLVYRHISLPVAEQVMKAHGLALFYLIYFIYYFIYILYFFLTIGPALQSHLYNLFCRHLGEQILREISFKMVGPGFPDKPHFVLNNEEVIKWQWVIWHTLWQEAS